MAAPRLPRLSRPTGETAHIIRWGPYTLAFWERWRMVVVEGSPILLTPLEYTVFRTLLAQPPRTLISISQLVSHCYAIQPQADQQRCSTRPLLQHIDHIRRKLREGGIDGITIRRVVDAGYVIDHAMDLPGLALAEQKRADAQKELAHQGQATPPPRKGAKR